MEQIILKLRDLEVRKKHFIILEEVEDTAAMEEIIMVEAEDMEQMAEITVEAEVDMEKVAMEVMVIVNMVVVEEDMEQAEMQVAMV